MTAVLVRAYQRHTRRRRGVGTDTDHRTNEKAKDMSRVLITGSTDGLGLMAGQLLLDQGHEVVLHARSPSRERDARSAAPRAADVVVGDLSSIERMRSVAEQINAIGRFDAIIHNAGVGYREPRRIVTEDGLCHVFAINVLAPYLLTATITPPHRLIYLSSGLHRRGVPDLSDLQWAHRGWDGAQAYSDSKLFDVVLAFAVARRWQQVVATALEPGWVATKMGGPGAPDDLSQGHVTQAWLATSEDPAATTSGAYFYHQRRQDTHPAVNDHALQEGLLAACADLTGVTLPGLGG
jgi:NAD(P)-dependent dehydrogenase (short-subunit alcohol dehydrogenase family)